MTLALGLLVGCDGPRVDEMDASGAQPDAGRSMPDAAPADAGHARDAGGEPADSGPPTCDELDCDDGVACTVDRCSSSTCMHEVQHEVCGEGSYCDATLGCVGGEACATDEDCPPSPGGCFGPPRCVPDSRTCTYPVLDGDLDGHGPPVCGGADCNDADPAIHPGAPDDCDGVDDDCSGTADAPLAEGACRDDQVCAEGACGCGPGTMDCFGACRDVANDPDHCGGCNVRCATNETCTAGECSCDAPYASCGTVFRSECVLRDSDEEHCGVCGLRCIDGAECVGGVCACPAGEIECPLGCAPLGTTSDCMACGDACGPGSTCTPTGCSPRFPWLAVYGSRDSDTWSTSGQSLAVAPDGGVVHVGYFFGESVYEVGGSSTPVVRGAEIVLSKHDAAGARVWMHRWYGSGSAGVTDVEVGSDGTIYVLLSSRGALTLHDETTLSSFSSQSLLIALDAAGNVLWHLFSGGEATPSDLDLTGSEITVVGTAPGTVDFGGGALSGSGSPGFVAILSAAGAHLASFRLPVEPQHVARRAGALWLGGVFRDTVTLGANTLTAVGTRADVFIAEVTTTGAVTSAFRFGLSIGDAISDLALLSGGDLILSVSTATLVRMTPAGAVVWYLPSDGAFNTMVEVDASDRIYASSYGGGSMVALRRYDASGALELDVPIGAQWLGVDVRGAEVGIGGVWDTSVQVGGRTVRAAVTGAPGVWMSKVEAP